MTAPAMRPMTRAECEAEIARLEKLAADRDWLAANGAAHWMAAEDQAVARDARATAAHYRATLEGMP